MFLEIMGNNGLISSLNVNSAEHEMQKENSNLFLCGSESLCNKYKIMEISTSSTSGQSVFKESLVILGCTYDEKAALIVLVCSLVRHKTSLIGQQTGKKYKLNASLTYRLLVALPRNCVQTGMLEKPQ